MTLTDKLIEDVLAGTFDVKKAAAEFEMRHKNEAQLNALSRELSLAMNRKDWDLAMAKLDEVEKLLPEGMRDRLDLTRFSILIGKKDYPAAYKLAGNISDANKDNAMIQNDLAWKMATDEAIEQRDLKLAEKIATRANEASKGENAAILDTVARVKFMNGKKSEAIALQEKAVKLADAETKPLVQQTLDSYRKGELPGAN
jgi:hypothetical protein